ncbi:MAG: lipase family alpha/beta hydrolase [Burkholderiales bacterium]
MRADPVPAVPATAPRPADLRGWARLGADAVVGITDAVEAMHAAIVRLSPPLGRARHGRTRGLTGFVYRTVRGTARAVGGGLELALAARAREPASAAGASSPRREALVAVLNGIWGDHLAASGNPLAIPMRLRVGGVPIDAAAGPPTGLGDGRRLLLMVHGLCMNDLQWTRAGHDHGVALADSAGWTPLRLHYDSGRHVADNGRELSATLEALLARWPVPVDEIAIRGHSMGGLVARAACIAAHEAGHAWPARLSALVFLGTPHLGAPLERGGHALERALGLSPYAAPFARLGRARSAGIVDLRHGAVRDARSAKPDPTSGAPLDAGLPRGVAAYAIAASRSAPGARGRLAGDGLVPVDSALGRHADPARALPIPDAHRRTIRAANHWDLLDRPEVTAQLLRWLSRAPRRGRRVTRPGSAAAR